MIAAAIYGTRWGKNRKGKENKTGMLGFTVPHEFLIQHGSIACASCCSFCLVAWFTQRKGNETKVCITSDVCMSVRRRGPVGNRAPACQLTLARPIGFPEEMERHKSLKIANSSNENLLKVVRTCIIEVML